MGAFQFSQPTWNTAAQAAGRPDLVGVPPNLASKADQDTVAVALYALDGQQPWLGDRCSLAYGCQRPAAAPAPAGTTSHSGGFPATWARQCSIRSLDDVSRAGGGGRAARPPGSVTPGWRGSRLGGQGRDVVVPVAAGQRKYGDDDDRGGPGRHAGVEGGRRSTARPAPCGPPRRCRSRPRPPILHELLVPAVGLWRTRPVVDDDDPERSGDHPQRRLGCRRHPRVAVPDGRPRRPPVRARLSGR